MSEKSDKKSSVISADKVKKPKNPPTEKPMRKNAGVRNDLMKFNKDNNQEYLAHAMNLVALPPFDVRLCKPEDIEQRSNEYFQMCYEDGIKPCIAGYALALNVSRMTLMDILYKKIAIPNDNYAALEQFYRVLNMLMEEYMLNGKINPVSAIFVMKNNFGYTDSQELVVAKTEAEESNPQGLIDESNLLLGEEVKNNGE